MDNQNINSNIQKNPRVAFSIASLVCGILSLLALCCVYFSPIFGLLAIIFAIISRYNKQFDKLATSGLITGIIGFAFGVFFFAIVLFSLSDDTMRKETMSMYKEMYDDIYGTGETEVPTPVDVETTE